MNLAILSIETLDILLRLILKAAHDDQTEDQIIALIDKIKDEVQQNKKYLPNIPAP